jgi:tripartite-type tricarboxylate transporter receptor subunit TctC
LKNHQITKSILQQLIDILFSCFAIISMADNWPSKPITIIVPFPAGGGTDAFARPLSAQLTKNLGKQIIIVNRGGAGGTLGANIAAKSNPDGYTFLWGLRTMLLHPPFIRSLTMTLKQALFP